MGNKTEKPFNAGITILTKPANGMMRLNWWALVGTSYLHKLLKTNPNKRTKEQVISREISASKMVICFAVFPPLNNISYKTFLSNIFQLLRFIKSLWASGQ